MCKHFELYKNTKSSFGGGIKIVAVQLDPNIHIIERLGLYLWNHSMIGSARAYAEQGTWTLVDNAEALKLLEPDHV